MVTIALCSTHSREEDEKVMLNQLLDIPMLITTYSVQQNILVFIVESHLFLPTTPTCTLTATTEQKQQQQQQHNAEFPLTLRCASYIQNEKHVQFIGKMHPWDAGKKFCKFF